MFTTQHSVVHEEPVLGRGITKYDNSGLPSLVPFLTAQRGPSYRALTVPVLALLAFFLCACHYSTVHLFGTLVAM